MNKSQSNQPLAAPGAKRRIERLVADGRTNQEIADAFGVPLSTFAGWKRHYGLTQLPSSDNPLAAPDGKERMKTLIDRGLTDNQAAKEMRVKVRAYRWWKKRYGLTKPRWASAMRQERERLEAWVAEGKTNAECAERLGVSLNTLIKWKRRWGLVKSKAKPTVVAGPRVRERLAELLVEGKTSADCAAIIGVSEATISRWKHKWGLTKPRRAAS